MLHYTDIRLQHPLIASHTVGPPASFTPLTIMAPKTRAGKEAQIELSQREEEEHIRGAYAACTKILKANRHAAPGVLRHLQALGYTEEGCGDVAAPSANTVALRAARAKQAEAKDLGTLATPEKIPIKYTSLGAPYHGLSTDLLLKKVLPSLEPLVLSTANL